MEGLTFGGRPGLRGLAGTSSSGGHQHRNVEEEPWQRSPSQGSEVRYCRRQHDVLVRYIRYALRCWAPQDEAPLSYWMHATEIRWPGSSPIKVTPELRRVLTRAKILCEECCRESPPLKAALRHAERSEAFADVLREIRWCASVVHNGRICKNVIEWSAPALRDFPWQAELGGQEQLLLPIAEQEDWEELMEELGRWNAGHQCSAEECGSMHAQGDPEYCLSTQMLARIPPAQDLKAAHDQGSFLWSFDRQVLGHGPPLGSGTFGAVSKVTWLGCEYAQKVFNHAGLLSLRGERDALVKMNHPHIVKVYAYSEDSLLMDLMCTDLYKFMEKRRKKKPARIRPFSLAAAIDLMLQIADAVSHMHSRKMAHRDLKSPNILVNPVKIAGLDGDDDDDDGFVFAKIADFGLAKVKREITLNARLTHNMGTKRWMAPEIFEENKKDDRALEDAFPMKADVYSFGVICFEILSGEEPYSGVRLSELYAKLTDPFPLRPRLPASCPMGLVSLICACWDADPKNRPTFADVCRVLRYLKALPTLTDDLRDKCLVDGDWPYGRLGPVMELMKMEGPMIYMFQDNPSTNLRLPHVKDIKGFKVDFSDSEKRKLSSVKLISNALMRASAPDSERSTGWISFDKQSEFLVQVEGSFQPASMFIGESWSTVTFITTTRKYGPFGKARRRDKQFCTEPGRVIACGSSIKFSAPVYQVGKIPEIVEC